MKRILRKLSVTGIIAFISVLGLSAQTTTTTQTAQTTTTTTSAATTTTDSTSSAPLAAVAVTSAIPAITATYLATSDARTAKYHADTNNLATAQHAILAGMTGFTPATRKQVLKQMREALKANRKAQQALDEQYRSDMEALHVQHLQQLFGSAATN